MKILALEARTFVHATEDRDKVIKALENLFPFSISVESQRASGQFGNPIEILTVKITKAKHIREFLEKLKRELGEEWERLAEEVEDRFQSGVFYIRIDKMLAYRGELKLGQGIQIELKVTSYPYNEEKIVEELAEFFSIR